MEQILKDQNELERKGQHRASLLLHSCCAPCSTAVIERLLPAFDLSVFYYNPNIYPQEEYEKRKAVQLRYLERFGSTIKFVDADYHQDEFFAAVKGLEDLPEGNERCRACYALRIEKTARAAAQNGTDFFTTTLSVSPHKNALWINELGQHFSEVYGVRFLPSDFKKKEGYKRSIELSKQFELYRQDYCGCKFSLKQRLSERCAKLENIDG